MALTPLDVLRQVNQANDQIASGADPSAALAEAEKIVNRLNRETGTTGSTPAAAAPSIPMGDRIRTKEQLGQYLDKIPAGAVLIGKYNGVPIYKKDGVYIRDKAGNQRIEVYHPSSQVSKNIDAGKDSFVPTG